MVGYADVKKWRENNKNKLFQAFGARCACCGLKDHPICYDFHHLDPTEKDFSLTQKILSWDALITEAKKCCMVCALCHRKIHSGIVRVPENFQQFDESLIEIRDDESLYSQCPVCANKKQKRRITCSRACAATLSGSVNWELYDLTEMLGRLKSYSAVGREVGVTGVAVKKRIMRSS
jgi:hypothetical protein